MSYAFQVFLTIGGGIKFIPLTGVTLPLISMGGSSMLSTLMMFAVIQGMYILREDEGEEVERAQTTESIRQEKSGQLPEELKFWIWKTKKRRKSCRTEEAPGPSGRTGRAVTGEYLRITYLFAGILPACSYIWCILMCSRAPM